MKFVVIRSNLREAIGSIERTAGDVPNLPVLRNVLVEARDGRITLTTTNLEVGVMVVVPGKIIEQGSVVAPLSLLAGLLGSLQSDRLNFEAKGHKIEIKTDNYTAALQGASPDDFPQIPAVQNKDHWLKIKGVILKEAIQQVVAASQISELRPELSSVLFDFSIESLVLTATDGFRLAEKTITKSFIETNDDSEPFRILVPLKAAQEVARSFMNDELIVLYHDNNQVVFKTDRLEIVSRLIDGQFPDYSQLIPEKFSTEITVDREEFMNALKVVSVLGQRNNEVAIALHQDKKTITIHSADQNIGENDYLLPVKAKGDGLDVLLNWRQVVDAIKVIPGESIYFGFQEETNPAIIKPINDTSYFYILKPLMKG